MAQAGKFGAVTIATNMAGRGTDIMLGGNAEYMAMTALRQQELLLRQGIRHSMADLVLTTRESLLRTSSKQHSL